VDQGDNLEMLRVADTLKKGETEILAKNTKKALEIPLRCDLTSRFRKIMLAGGLMNFTRIGKKV
jgi:hypothetical protein